jgi:hypothetical protein
MPIGVYSQLATYWGTGVIDGFGKRAFADPVTLYVRWQDAQQMLANKMGENIPCNAVVLVQEDVEIGGYMALGDYSDTGTLTEDPTTLVNAYQIYEFTSIPSVTGADYNKKASLRPSFNNYGN